MSQLLARDRFYQEIRQPDNAINLAAAALYIAQEEYPELDCDVYLNRLDTMALQLRDRLPETTYPLKIIRAINEYLFEAQGFTGNSQHYYDPRNSFLNQVLDRRTGIPITLSLVYLELSRRVGLPMAGVGMPGHFLVRPTVNEMAIFVDAFNKGEILFEEDCRDRIEVLYGRGAPLSSEHLAPIGPRPFLARILMNLKVIYLQQQDVPRALATIDRILALLPDACMERRDRGLLHYRQGQLMAAEADLKDYLRQSPNAQDAFEIEQVISQIKQMLKE